MPVDPKRGAALVESIHQPWRATLGECLQRWRGLDAQARAACYLVLDGEEPTTRHTLNARRIAELAASLPSGEERPLAA